MFSLMLGFFKCVNLFLNLFYHNGESFNHLVRGNAIIESQIQGVESLCRLTQLHGEITMYYQISYIFYHNMDCLR